jgi:hypothetical protein
MAPGAAGAAQARACPAARYCGRIFNSARVCAPSGLKDEGSRDKSYDHYQKPSRNEGEEKLGHGGQTHEPGHYAYGAAGLLIAGPFATSLSSALG